MHGDRLGRTFDERERRRRRALSVARLRHPTIVWRFVEKDRAEEALRAALPSLAWQRLTGAVPFQRGPSLPAFDVFFCSRSEGTPIALLEAMAAACLVATRVGGVQMLWMLSGQLVTARCRWNRRRYLSVRHPDLRPSRGARESGSSTASTRSNGSRYESFITRRRPQRITPAS